MPNEVGPYPQPHSVDRLQDGAEVVINLIPIAGGALSTLLSKAIEPSLERRRIAWLEKIATLVEELARQQVTPAQLAEDEAWVSALAAATRVAMGTHIEEKLTLLKRVLASLKLSAEDADKDIVASRFVKYVEDFEPHHFLALRLAYESWTFDSGCLSDERSTSTAHPESNWPPAPNALKIILNDLQTADLLSLAPVGTDPDSILLHSRVTAHGELLLRWTEIV